MIFIILRRQLRSHLTDRTTDHLESGEGAFFLFFLFGLVENLWCPRVWGGEKKKKEKRKSTETIQTRGRVE